MKLVKFLMCFFRGYHHHVSIPSDVLNWRALYCEDCKLHWYFGTHASGRDWNNKPVCDFWLPFQWGNFVFGSKTARQKIAEVGKQPTTAPCCSVEGSHISEIETSA
jgi:hypothetical protein